jgi:hypothetical protein
MKQVSGILLGVFLATGAMAQDQEEAKNGDIATLRALDTITGIVEELSLKPGESMTYERLTILLRECRYTPTDSYASLVIRDVREKTPRFDGWMVASSPALSAMDHPRYDVWLLSCKTSEG